MQFRVPPDRDAKKSPTSETLEFEQPQGRTRSSLQHVSHLWMTIDKLSPVLGTQLQGCTVELRLAEGVS